MRPCHLIDAGIVPYQDAWEWQRRLVTERSAGHGQDTLLLLEHPPTITLGRAARREHILVADDERTHRGVALVESDRGGDVTYHAPGQIVGYPILKLVHYGGSVIRYVRNLEDVIIQVLAVYGILGMRVEGLTGVWVEHAHTETPPCQNTNHTVSSRLAKVAAIGVKLSASGITSHGFALNVAPDLHGFAQIVPCGIQEHGVTSLEQLLGAAAPLLDEVKAHIVTCFARVFEIDVIVSNRDGTPYA